MRMAAPFSLLLLGSLVGLVGCATSSPEERGAGEETVATQPAPEPQGLLPGGEWIAFASERGGTDGIFAVRADGTGLKRLTQKPFHSGLTGPTWSPQGKGLAFGNNTGHLYVMDLRDGSLNEPVGKQSGAFSTLDWSPEGGRFAYSAGGWSTQDIHVLQLANKRSRCLGVHGSNDSDPAWSPDGKRIAFTAYLPSGSWAEKTPLPEPCSGKRYEGASGPVKPTLFTMRPDGSDVVRIGEGMQPAWSPDGQRLAYADLLKEGSYEIFVADADGSNKQRLTTHGDPDKAPSWSPDGERIAFQSRRTGNYDLFVIGADGTGLRQLTHSPEDEEDPAWRPMP